MLFLTAYAAVTLAAIWGVLKAEAAHGGYSTNNAVTRLEDYLAQREFDRLHKAEE